MIVVKLYRTIYRWIIWNLVSRTFVAVMLWPKFRFKKTADSQKLPKPPFIVVANHGTFFDPWLVGGYSRYPFAIMCNDDAFTSGGFSKWYLTSIGAFPKKKGASDFKAMKRTLLELHKGYPVCIFPEGQTTWEGPTQLMYKGIEKIIKKSGVPLVMVRIRGNFLCKPWWAHTQRRGGVRLTFSVMKPHELAQMSDDQLFVHMRETLTHNDITDPVVRAIPFSGKDMALGIERCAWECMYCGAYDMLETIGNTISCISCGKSISLDAYCHLFTAGGTKAVYENLSAWMAASRNHVLEKIAGAESHTLLCSSEKVLLQTPCGQGIFADAGYGTLQLTKESLMFDDGISKREIRVAEIRHSVIQKKDIVEIESTHGTLRYLFSHQSPLKWVYFIRYLGGYETFEKQGFIG